MRTSGWNPGTRVGSALTPQCSCSVAAAVLCAGIRIRSWPSRRCAGRTGMQRGERRRGGSGRTEEEERSNGTHTPTAAGGPLFNSTTAFPAAALQQEEHDPLVCPLDRIFRVPRGKRAACRRDQCNLMWLRRFCCACSVDRAKYGKRVAASRCTLACIYRRRHSRRSLSHCTLALPKSPPLPLSVLCSRSRSAAVVLYCS